MKFSKLARHLSGSATMAATLKAQELKKQGHDIVLATVGEPDLDTDELVKKALMTQVATQMSRYGSSQGLLSTRTQISKWFGKVYGVSYSPQNILVTPGSKFALYSLLQILCEKQNEVLVPAPYWVSYVTLAEMAQATAVICAPDLNYKLNAQTLQSCLNENSRVLLLNSPNNPTGAVYSTEELQDIYKVLQKFPDVTVICDDIYNQLIFSDEPRAPSLLDFADDEFKQRLIVVHGVSKSYAMTGWRMGWVATHNTECIAKLNAFCSQSLTCVPDFIQLAAETALSQGDQFVSNFRKLNQQRHQFLTHELRGIKKISVYSSAGAFYVWLKLLDTTLSSVDVTDKLLTEKGLAVVPGEAFGMPYHLRVSVTLSDVDLKKAAQRLKDYFQ